jgi:PAS domain S-box-containing protein
MNKPEGLDRMGFSLQPGSIRGELARFLFVLALPLVAMVVYVLYDRAQHDVADAEAVVRRLAESGARRVARDLAETRTALEAIARRPLIRAMDPARCDPELRDLLALYPRASNIQVVDRSGRIICSALPLPRDRIVRVRDEELLQLVLGKGQFGLSRPLPGPNGKRWTVAAAHPIQTEVGVVLGGVGMSIDLLNWRPFPELAGLPPETIVALISDQTVIARSVEAELWIGRDVSGSEILRIARERTEGVAHAQGVREIARFWAYRRVPETAWTVLAGIPSEQIYGPARTRNLQSAIVVALVVAGTLLLGLVLARRISLPIRDIADALRLRREGRLELRMPVAGPQEVATVAAELNRGIEQGELAAHSLRESEERFRALWTACADAILLIDEHGTVRYANPAVMDVFGFRVEEMVGQGIELVQPPREAAAHRAALQRYVRTGERRLNWRSSLTTARRKDGTDFPVEVSFNELRLGGQRFFAGFVRDVTEREALLARMQMQLERMPLACLLFDADLRITYANPAAEATFGWSAAEMRGRSALQLYVPPERQAVVGQIMQRLRRGEFVTAAGESLRRDGTRVALEWVNTPLTGPGGAFLGLMSMAADVSDRLRAQRRLALAQRLFAALSEVNEAVVRVGEPDELYREVCRICVAELGFRVAFVALVDAARGGATPRVAAGPGSEAARELFFPLDPGHPLAATVTSSAVRLGKASVANDVDADPARAAARDIRERIGSRSTASFPLHRGGEVIGALTVHAEVVDFFDADVVELLTRMAGDVSFALDKLAEHDSLAALTRELEERVRRRTAELESANQELEAFSYSVSHDLRAPVRHIDGFLRLLAREMPGADGKALHYLDTIGAAAKRMGMLIDDMLTLSRTGRQDVRLQPVDLGALVRELVHESALDAGQRRVEWSVGELPTIMADPSLLRIVMQNLMSNSLKYTRSRVPAKIAIEARPAAEGRVEISVRDNGVGFDPRYKDKLFGVFQRLHRDEEFEGTGIGLATARRILHRHGQRIWGEGVPGEGATFTLTLALADTEVVDESRAHPAG